MSTTSSHSWLRIAFLQPERSLTEIFYLDKPAGKLFSIHFLDYFLLESEKEQQTTSYGEGTINFIVEMLHRIEAKDSAIISLPCVSSEEWEEALDIFCSLKSNHPEIDLLRRQVRRYYEEVEGRLPDLLTGVRDTDLKEEFYEWMYERADPQIDAFLDEHGLRAADLIVIELDQEIDITISLDEEE